MLALDIRLLVKAASTDAEWQTWTWPSGHSPLASMRFKINADNLSLAYLSKDLFTQVWRRMAQKIRLSRSSCYLGGTRPWFHCPKCSARCCVLYGSSTYFGCRSCHELAYPSQFESRDARLLRRARKDRRIARVSSCDRMGGFL